MVYAPYPIIILLYNYFSYTVISIISNLIIKKLVQQGPKFGIIMNLQRFLEGKFSLFISQIAEFSDFKMMAMCHFELFKLEKKILEKSSSHDSIKHFLIPFSYDF